MFNEIFPPLRETNLRYKMWIIELYKAVRNVSRRDGIEYFVSYIKPLEKGGSDTFTNLQITVEEIKGGL